MRWCELHGQHVLCVRAEVRAQGRREREREREREKRFMNKYFGISKSNTGIISYSTLYFAFVSANDDRSWRLTLQISMTAWGLVFCQHVPSLWHREPRNVLCFFTVICCLSCAGHVIFTMCDGYCEYSVLCADLATVPKLHQLVWCESHCPSVKLRCGGSGWYGLLACDAR